MNKGQITPFLFVLLTAIVSLLWSCSSDDNGTDCCPTTPTETDFVDLLTNQVDRVIIPAMESYEEKQALLDNAVRAFVGSIDDNNLGLLRVAFEEAYMVYQAVAVHNYYATENANLVNSTNLYPIDTALLASLIESESYNFNGSSQERANGFPAMEFMLYGPEDVLAYFSTDSKRGAFLQALVADMKSKAQALTSSWKGSLRSGFIGNGGTALGSSVSVQLNQSLVYYEDHIRENKVGIPIGRLGPNDSPIEADASKIEAYYLAQFANNESFTLSLLRAAVEEMEDLYLGESINGDNGQGYDDLLLARSQSSVDQDIKAQFADIYSKIDNRASINGNDDLYNSIQGLVTLYKSDLFPVLNVQDADGANDGD